MASGLSIKQWRIWTVFFILTALNTSLIMNFFQLLTYIFIRPKWKSTFNSMSCLLAYVAFSQIGAVAEWWFGTRLKIYFADKETKALFTKEKSLWILSHSCHLDWVVHWLIVIKTGMVAHAKNVVKAAVSRVPGFGWLFALSDQIAINRSWDKDEALISKTVEKFYDYPGPMTIVLFPEGTVYSPEKHAESEVFCQERNLKPLKYHLAPRTKGFHLCMKLISQKIPAVYDIQFCYPKKGFDVSLLQHVIEGIPVEASVYIRRIKVDEIPVESAKECGEWLHNLFIEKDERAEKYYEDPDFAGPHFEFGRSIIPLIWIVLWFSITTILVFSITKYALSVCGAYTMATACLSILLVASILKRSFQECCVS